MFSPSLSFASLIDAFDVFTDCFVYGSIAYLIMITAIGLVLGLCDIIEEYQAAKKGSAPDFYDQVKELRDYVREY